MKFILTIIFTLGIAVFFALLAIKHPGYIVLAQEAYTIRMPLVLFILLLVLTFIVIYLLLRFIVNIYRAPRNLRRWQTRANESRVQTSTMQGYASLIEGEWNHAESKLLKKLQYNKSPLLNYLGAAYAAQKQGHFDKRDKYLDEAIKTHPAQQFPIHLTRARLLIQSGEYDEACDLLQTLHEEHPKNLPVVRLLAEVCQQLGEWTLLLRLMPVLKKLKAFPESEQVVKETLTYNNCLVAVTTQQGDVDQLVSTWKAWPKKVRRNTQVIISYVRQLIASGAMNYAEGVIRKTLYNNWNSELAYLYGMVESRTIDNQITTAEYWARKHGDDPDLMLTLGRLYRRAQRLEEARDKFQDTISAGGREESCAELGTLLEQMGETENAMLCYKRGMAALGNKPTQLFTSPTTATELVLSNGANGDSAMPVLK